MYELNEKREHQYILTEKTKTFSLLGTKESKLKESFRLDTSSDAMKKTTTEQF
jgi:hypothetical protein